MGAPCFRIAVHPGAKAITLGPLLDYPAQDEVLLNRGSTLNVIRSTLGYAHSTSDAAEGELMGADRANVEPPSKAVRSAALSGKSAVRSGIGMLCQCANLPFARGSGLVKCHYQIFANLAPRHCQLMPSGHRGAAQATPGTRSHQTICRDQLPIRSCVV